MNVFLFDDNIPKLPELLEKNLYEGGIIRQETLEKLVGDAPWTGEQGLWELTRNLVTHPYTKAGRICLTGFLDPEFYLSRKSDFSPPDVAVFDWEYNFTLDRQAEVPLLEFLKETDAFVFVYSSFKEFIPPSLIKSAFDPFAKRLQLFEKGNKENSALSSEDFIFQYILTYINKDNTIKVQSTDVVFESGGYLESPTDIRFLESILGREALLRGIRSHGNEISTSTVEKMIEGAKGEILTDERRRFLVATDATLFIDKFNPTERITYLEALRSFGIKKLQEALEIGFARI